MLASETVLLSYLLFLYYNSMFSFDFKIQYFTN